MKRCRLVSVVKLTTFLAPYEHVLITYCRSFQVFLFLKSVCVNMVMQIRVQIGDTRMMNPPWGVEDLKKLHFV